MERLEGLSSDYHLTTRALYTSLPFDTGQATLFVPEKGISKTTGGTSHDSTSEDEGEGESRSKRTKISGEEARQFYEDVLLMPKESRRDKSHLRKKTESMKRRKRKDTKSRRKASVVREITSLGQLFLCVQEGDFEPIRSALSKQLYDINAVDNFNWTLLMCAAHAGHMTIVKYLLDHGADWQHRTDRRGNNAADLARTAGHTNIAEFIESHNRTSSGPIHGQSRRQKLPETRTITEDRREMRRYSSSSSSATGQSFSSFYCEICKITVELGSSTRNKHTTSTVHQFSCQHKPKVTPYGIPESNRGFQLLLKGGWDPERGLGPDQQGQQFPVKTVLKQDRLGFGLSSRETKPRVTHFSAHDEAAVKSHRERTEGEKEQPLKKKDILKAAEKDRRWERRMRRYMNSDYDVPLR
jgi:hypothetical protein